MRDETMLAQYLWILNRPALIATDGAFVAGQTEACRRVERRSDELLEFRVRERAAFDASVA